MKCLVFITMLCATAVVADQAGYQDPEHRQHVVSQEYYQHPSYYYQEQPVQQQRPQQQRPSYFARAMTIKEGLLNMMPQPNFYEISLFVTEIVVVAVSVIGVLYGVAFAVNYFTGNDFKFEIGKSFPSFEDAAPFITLATDVMKQIEQASEEFEKSNKDDNEEEHSL